MIEIAITSHSIDRAKAAVYAEAEVKEYWIVIPARREVEVYRLPREGKYAETMVVTEPAVLTCPHLPQVRVDLAELFAGIPADA